MLKQSKSLKSSQDLKPFLKGAITAISALLFLIPLYDAVSGPGSVPTAGGYNRVREFSPRYKLSGIESYNHIFEGPSRDPVRFREDDIAASDLFQLAIGRHLDARVNYEISTGIAFSTTPESRWNLREKLNYDENWNLTLIGRRIQAIETPIYSHHTRRLVPLTLITSIDVALEYLGSSSSLKSLIENVKRDIENSDFAEGTSQYQLLKAFRDYFTEVSTHEGLNQLREETAIYHIGPPPSINARIENPSKKAARKALKDSAEELLRTLVDAAKAKGENLNDYFENKQALRNGLNAARTQLLLDRQAFENAMKENLEF
jgi:hypothetical protein